MMESLGQVNNRQIEYINVRSNPNWSEQLPSKHWIAFTIADIGDRVLIKEVTIKCLDKGVLYTCSVGQLASITEDYFDEEIVWRQVQAEESTGLAANYDKTLMTTFHRNFSEGFWFSTYLANPTINDEYLKVDTVACIDFTKSGVRQHLLKLIKQMNDGWLPKDDEAEIPHYDN